MINSINIKNFRGIKKGILKDFARFNLLIGDNNTGKSTILEALYLTSTANSKARLTENAQTYNIMVSSTDYMGYNPSSRVREKHACSRLQKNINQFYNREIYTEIKSEDSPFYNFKFKEAKDFIRIYTTIIRLGVSPPIFADKVITHSSNEDIQKVLHSFIEALNYLNK